MKKFIILAKESSRYSDGPNYSVVGEFNNVESANNAIISKVKNFQEAQDGGGTEFLKINEGNYIEKDGKFFVNPGSITESNSFETPEEVREQLERW